MTTDARYFTMSTINHWVTALLVVAMLALGLAAGAAPSEATEDYVIGIHVSLGFFAALFVAWRAIYRLYEGFPNQLGPTATER